MELETVIGYLVALAVPLWLTAEGIKVSQRSSKQPEKQLKVERLPRKPAPRSPATATASSRV
jgi:hypothetical protein